MRPIAALPLLALLSFAADPLPEDVAAAHPEGKWQLRKAELYAYLVRFNANGPNARLVLPDYMKLRFIQSEARRRKLLVTDADLDAWLSRLDRQIREASGGKYTLEDKRKDEGMTAAGLRRRAQTAILRERIARDVFCEKDPSRDRKQEVPEDSVEVCIDEMYRLAPKEVDPARLPKGVVARVADAEITEYQFGQELSFSLPEKEVLDALGQLIVTKEAPLLTGSEDPPSAEELDFHKKWFMAYQMSRLRAQVRDPKLVTEETVRQVLEKQGLTPELVYANPAFLAEARVRGHFRNSVTDEDLRKYYEGNRARYGDKLRVARILVEARNQRQVQAFGQKTRNLEQGKALSDALWIRVTQGQDFGEVARESSEDVKVIKENGGVLPLLISAETPGYEDTFAGADALKRGEISKPFYSMRAGGYIIVKLIERQAAPAFEEIRTRIRDDAADEKFLIWKRKTLQSAVQSAAIVEDKR